MSIPSRTTSAEYTFTAETERDRLFIQFELHKESFRRSFVRLLSKAHLAEDNAWRALDVACGEGLYAADIVERCPQGKVVGFDRDSEAISTAVTAFCLQPRLEFRVADVHQPLSPVVGDGFDVAYVQFGLGHFKFGATALQQVYEVLRPGGTVMLLDPTEKIFAYPHPSAEVLASVLRRTWPTYGTYASGDLHGKLLAQTGFVDIETEPQDSPLGGSTKAGQARLACLLQAFQSGRDAFVERAKVISAADFDDNLSKLTRSVGPDVEGTSLFRLAFGRKADKSRG